VAAGAGAAEIAAPFSLTPPGAAAEVVAGGLVAGGGATALTGYIMQLGGATFLAFQGDAGPIDSMFASVANSILPSVPILPSSPFGSNFSSRAARSKCHR
jgi:hypothetical protein